MKLVAVSVVKNDADIVEPFVRHTRTWVDHHLIFDHDSTDGTREILGALQREGLPLTVFTDDAVANLQQARCNHLTRLAVHAWNADWVLVLDADEILIGPDRPALETLLAAEAGTGPVSLPLLDYYHTNADDARVANPAERLRYCQSAPSSTRKLFIPRSVAEDPRTIVGMGNHAVHQEGRLLADHPLPPDYWLAHLSLRSPAQHVMRVVSWELQKLSGGRRQAGVALHYRLGFQLLAESPELFLATTCLDAANLRRLPVDYRGGDLRYTSAADWPRLARSLLPLLEKLAVSHGALIDHASTAGAEPTEAANFPIRELVAAETDCTSHIGSPDAFTGFVAQEGWGPREGPVPQAFLPPFHWAMAPQTKLLVPAAEARDATFVAEALTYSENQKVTLTLNGHAQEQFTFSRVNEKRRLVARLPLRAGENQIVLSYDQYLQTHYDPRRLAVIFLSLRIIE